MPYVSYDINGNILNLGDVIFILRFPLLLYYFNSHKACNEINYAFGLGYFVSPTTSVKSICSQSKLFTSLIFLAKYSL